VYIKWREVLAQKRAMLEILSKTTGRSQSQLDADMARPLYMQPGDALKYGVIDKIMQPGGKDDISGKVKGAVRPSVAI